MNNKLLGNNEKIGKILIVRYTESVCYYNVL